MGKALIKQIEKKSEEKGIRISYIHAESSNPDAIKLYESCGYFVGRIQLRKEI